MVVIKKPAAFKGVRGWRRIIFNDWESALNRFTIQLEERMPRQ